MARTTGLRSRQHAQQLARTTDLTDDGRTVSARCPECREHFEVPHRFGRAQRTALRAELVEHLRLTCDPQPARSLVGAVA